MPFVKFRRVDAYSSQPLTDSNPKAFVWIDPDSVRYVIGNDELAFCHVHWSDEDYDCVEGSPSDVTSKLLQMLSGDPLVLAIERLCAVIKMHP